MEMLFFIVTAVVLTTTVCGQNGNAPGEILIPQDKLGCLDKMLQWCNDMKYPEEGAGMAMVAISYVDNTGHHRVFCSSDSDGTNCTKDSLPWFTCTNDHKFMYKGQQLEAGDQNVDEDICNMTDKAFNDIFVQNLSYDNVTLKKEVEKSLENFFDELAAMQEQIDALYNRMKGIPLFSGDVFNVFGGAGSQGTNENSNSSTTDSVESKNTNEIEREVK